MARENTRKSRASSIWRGAPAKTLWDPAMACDASPQALSMRSAALSPCGGDRNTSRGVDPPSGPRCTRRPTRSASAASGPPTRSARAATTPSMPQGHTASSITDSRERRRRRMPSSVSAAAVITVTGTVRNTVSAPAETTPDEAMAEDIRSFISGERTNASTSPRRPRRGMAKRSE